MYCEIEFLQIQMSKIHAMANNNKDRQGVLVRLISKKFDCHEMSGFEDHFHYRVYDLVRHITCTLSDHYNYEKPDKYYEHNDAWIVPDWVTPSEEGDRVGVRVMHKYWSYEQCLAFAHMLLALAHVHHWCTEEV